MEGCNRTVLRTAVGIIVVRHKPGTRTKSKCEGTTDGANVSAKEVAAVWVGTCVEPTVGAVLEP